MSFVRIASTAELPSEGSAISVQTRFGRIGIAKIDGELFAFDDLCTHDDGPLVSADGKLEGKCVTCPRHGAQFDVTNGEVLRMPATEDIETYPVRVSGDDVEVDLA